MLARADDRLQQLKYEPPRSWDREAKLAFLHLPPALQAFYVTREKDRDRTVRKAQNDAAASRDQLAAATARIAELEAKLKTLQEGKTDHGTTENCTTTA